MHYKKVLGNVPSWQKNTKNTFVLLREWEWTRVVSTCNLEKKCFMLDKVAALLNSVFVFYLSPRLIDWLIIYCFTTRSRTFHLNGGVTNTVKGLQSLVLCSARRTFEQGGIFNFFIVPHLLWHGTSFFLVSSEGPPHSVTSYDTRGDVKDEF
jgi:hypothetical protein